MASKPPRKPNVQHFYPVDIVEIPKRSRRSRGDDESDPKQPSHDESTHPNGPPIYTPPPTQELEKHVIVMPSLHVETSSQWAKLLWNWVEDGIARGDDVWKGDHLGEIGLDNGGFVDQTNFRDYLKYVKDSKLQQAKKSLSGLQSSEPSTPFPFSFSNFDKVLEQPGEKRVIPLMRPTYWAKLTQHGKDVLFEQKLSEWSAWNFEVLKKKLQVEKYKEREQIKLNTVVHGSDFHLGQVERVMGWAIGPKQIPQPAPSQDSSEEAPQPSQQRQEGEVTKQGQSFRGNMAWGNADKFDRGTASQGMDGGQANISESAGTDSKPDK
jgi:hypothetical protein